MKNKGFFWQWNLLYYFLIRWENKIQQIFNYPLFLLLKLKSIRKVYAKRGVKNPENIIKNALNNPITGTNSIISGIHMGVLIFMLEYAIFNFVQVLIRKSLIQFFFQDIHSVIIFLIFFIAPAGIINYCVLFKKDRYIEYFKLFSKFSKLELKRNSWKSFFVILSFWMTLILSFVAYVYFI